jgi:hypothetical protein
MRAVLICAAALAAVALGAAPAAAAPGVTTGPATKVTATSATLTGTVDPHGVDTTWHFEFGTTTAYGGSTTNGTAKGNASKSVSGDIDGLAPSTTYHYRLVATSGTETVNGADMTFATPAAAPGTPVITIAASPRTVTYGKSTTIAGTVTGNGSTGAKVSLLQNPFPFTGAFSKTADGTTSSTGAFSFTVTPTVNTRYKLDAKTSPSSSSAEFLVPVRVKVTLRLGDRTPASGQRVRFRGTVTPAHDGTQARIQRKTASGWKTIRTSTLVAGTPVNGVAVSKYSKRIRIRKTSRYRTVVVPTDGDHVRGKSARKRAVVH